MFTTYRPTLRILLEEIYSVVLVQVALSTAAFLSTPKNTVASLGTRVELECSTNLSNHPLRWTYYASNNPQRLNAIFNGRNVSQVFAPIYEVDASPDSGRYNLIIKSAEFSCAGEYICAEDPFAINATVAFLTVIASDPVCETNVNSTNNGIVENDDLLAWCRVTYIGRGIPLMIWTLDSITNVISNEAVNSSGAVSTFTSKIKVKVNSRTNGMITSCKTIFEQRELPERFLVKEILNYTHIWNYPINVLYGPRNLKIMPISSTFAVSDSLVCSADGNPSPTYIWTETETGKAINGPVLTLEESVTPDTDHTFQCTAVNEVSGQMKSTSFNITFNVTALSRKTGATPTLSQFDLLLPIVIPLTLAAILMLFVGILRVLRARVNASTENRRPELGNLELSEIVAQPTMQSEIEDHPYSEVAVDVARESVEPHEASYAGLTGRPGRVQGSPEKAVYTQLRMIDNVAPNEYADYIEIV